MPGVSRAQRLSTGVIRLAPVLRVQRGSRAFAVRRMMEMMHTSSANDCHAELLRELYCFHVCC